MARNPHYPRSLSSCCSEDEYARVQHAAETAGLSVCAYVRARAVGAHVAAKQPKTDRDTIAELQKLGGSLKRFWSVADAAGNAALSAEASAALSELREAVKRIGW